MRLRTRKIDAPKVNETVKVTKGAIIELFGPFYNGKIDFKDKISNFKTPIVNFKHLHNPSLSLKIEKRESPPQR